MVQPALEGAHCVLGLHELCFDLIAYFKIKDYILLIRWEELRRGLVCTTSAEGLITGEYQGVHTDFLVKL